MIIEISLIAKVKCNNILNNIRYMKKKMKVLLAQLSLTI